MVEALLEIQGKPVEWLTSVLAQLDDGLQGIGEISRRAARHAAVHGGGDTASPTAEGLSAQDTGPEPVKCAQDCNWPGVRHRGQADIRAGVKDVGEGRQCVEWKEAEFGRLEATDAWSATNAQLPLDLGPCG